MLTQGREVLFKEGGWVSECSQTPQRPPAGMEDGEHRLTVSLLPAQGQPGCQGDLPGLPTQPRGHWDPKTSAPR